MARTLSGETMKLQRKSVLVIAALVCVILVPHLASAQTCTAADCPAGYNQITAPPYFGTAGSDCMIGTAANDTMIGFGGDDFICGNAGNDTILGQGGNDQLTGNDGDDTILGGDDDDVIDGGDGSDNLFGDAGSDTIVGGADNDVLIGGAGDDFAFGGDGNDTVQGDAGLDFLSGDDGDDVLLGGDDPDTILGGAGADRVEGEGGDDPFLSGGDDDDTVNGGDGSDTIFGDAGTDALNGGLGDDTLNGGSGPDIINGDDGDDTLNGDTDNDTLDGGDGTDTLLGGDGFDNCLNGEVTLGCELFSHVALSSFDVIVEGNDVVVRWVTSSETGTVGYYLYGEVDGEWVQLHEGLLPGLVSAPQGGTYEFRDDQQRSRYLLAELDIHGARNLYGPYEVTPVQGSAQVAIDRQLYARVAHSSTNSRRAKANGAPVEGPGQATSVHVGVSETALYSLKAMQLATLLAMDLTTVQAKILSGDFSLTESGQPVAWTVSTDGSELVFVGFASESIYADQRIYSISPAAGVQMNTVDGTPNVLAADPSFLSEKRFEVNEKPGVLIAQDPESDYWFSQLITASPMMPTSANVTMNITDVVTDRRDAALNIALHGVTPEVHSVDVVVNGTLVGSVEFNGTVYHQSSVSVPAALLVEGDNTLELVPTGATDSMIFLDFAELSYERSYIASEGRLQFISDLTESLEVDGLAATTRIFDISDRRSPVEVTNVNVDGVTAQFAAQVGVRYLTVDSVATPDSIWGDVPSAWRTPQNQADYVLIAPAEFVTVAQGLAEYRATQGHQVAVVELQDIFDEFANGEANPNAIREFITYAHDSWDVAPKFVTLVGSGSFDYRDYGNFGDNFVPPLMVRTGSGIYASDMRFGDLEGDGLSDVAIGRLPVTSIADLQSVVQQLIDYDARNAERSNNAVFVADSIDPVSNFSDASDVLVESLPLEWSIDRVYRSESSFDDFRANLMSAIDSSPRVINYLGHSGLESLGKEESLFSVSDVSTIAADGLQSVYLLITCSASRFAIPDNDSLGEELLLSDTGAIAVWGPSGLSIDNQAQIFASEFLRKGFSTDGVTLGEAIGSAQVALLEAGGTTDMTAIYQLFGDPAMALISKVDEAPSADGGTVNSGSGLSGGSAGCALAWSPSPMGGFVLVLALVTIARRRRR